MTTPIALSNAISLAPKQADQAGLKKAAQQFEAVFLRQMISSMRSASLGEDILGSSASDQFRDMSDARTADSMAEKGALGIAEMLMKQFVPQVGKTDDPLAPATLSKGLTASVVKTDK
ncbi:hypothetical protein ACFB49_34840 [Sphingomonas sp. DBB INV C78]|uniref:rod-binding protein n=1 Tax=Sphingomonas sp. DBB INV C78 TaxID=3349434 RepID=UPI0036D41286